MVMHQIFNKISLLSLITLTLLMGTSNTGFAMEQEEEGKKSSPTQRTLTYDDEVYLWLRRTYPFRSWLDKRGLFVGEIVESGSQDVFRKALQFIDDTDLHKTWVGAFYAHAQVKAIMREIAQGNTPSLDALEDVCKNIANWDGV